MSESFFNYILASGGSRQNREEILKNEIPIIFKSNGHRLRDYKIYGANGGVGDLDSSTGKYHIPVIVLGKNVLENTRVGRSVAITAVINDDGSVTFSGTASARVDFYIVGAYGSTDSILSQQDTYICSCVTDTAVPNGVQFLVGYNRTTYSAVSVNTEYSLTTSQISYFTIRIPAGTTLNNVTFYPMIRNAGFDDSDFEPYYTQTVVISVDESLDENDYIDFREQRRYNADGTVETTDLPALMTIDGTNIIAVSTAVQPEKVCLQGNISEVVLSQVKQLVSVLPKNTQIDMMDETDEDLSLDIALESDLSSQ